MKSMLEIFLAGVMVVIPIHLSAQQNGEYQAKHRTYRVVVLPPQGGADSYLAGYLFYAPLTDRGTLGVTVDTSTPGALNSYTWTNGRKVNLQPLPQLPNLTGTNTFINWINEPGLAAGYGTRVNSSIGASVDNAAIWTPNGQVFELSTPDGDQSRAVWVNDFGQVSGWIANSTVDSCSGFFSGTGFQTQGVVWELGAMVPLGTLGGTNSYGEFINNRGQVSGHSQTTNVPDPTFGCPPFDPFIWENGKMIDINPGNFGGPFGGTNFLNNRGQATGSGDDQDLHPHPFLWDNGKVTDLFTVGNLGGSFGGGLNVNEEGHVVGIASLPGDESSHGVLWREIEFVDLKTLPGDTCSEPTFINSHDQIVGVSAPCDFSSQRAFLWENGEMVDLNLLIPADSGIQLVSADWINENGDIAAQGVLTANGDTRAVFLIPEGGCNNECEAAISASQHQAELAAQAGTPKLTAAQKARLRIRARGRSQRLAFGNESQISR
jgi:probable HAF family extracellular repeat protein